jgi:uncharacterized protein YjbJ (UPF0337 family)
MTRASARPAIGRRTRRPSLVLAALVAALAVGVSACSSDKKSSDNAATTTTAAPEHVKLPIAQVLAKLPDMVAIGTQAAAEAKAGAFDKAKATADTIEGVWSQVEGTVKDRSGDIYVTIEDAQSRIEKGIENKKADDVEAGAKDQATAVATFVAKYAS